MCMRFRGTLLPTCEEVRSCNIPVFWLQLWHIRKTHISAYRSSMQPGSRSFEVPYILYTKSPEAQGLLEEIRRQSSVSTNVA